MDKKKFMKFFKEWKWALILLFICIAGIPLTTIYGIKSVNWGNDFWPNALSEFLGMFVDLLFGSIFTFVVIDKYLQYHKNKQWKKIKNVTYKNLYFILSNILLKLNWALPKEMRVGSYILTEDMETLNDYLPKEDFGIFANSLSQNIDKLTQEQHSYLFAKADEVKPINDSKINLALVKFKQQTKSDINSLTSLLIPKLLNFSDDTDLLDNVIELEELFTSLMSKINNMQGKNIRGVNDINYVWLQTINKLLNRIKVIADIMQNDIDLE